MGVHNNFYATANDHVINYVVLLKFRFNAITVAKTKVSKLGSIRCGTEVEVNDF